MPLSVSASAVGQIDLRERASRSAARPRLTSAANAASSASTRLVEGALLRAAMAMALPVV
jgi:hypothetical protein